MGIQFGQDDHLSQFPDEILQQILSKLPFVEAVQSSILAHRWVNLWASIPNIELKQKDTELLLEFLNRGHFILARHNAAPIEKLDFGVRNMHEFFCHPLFAAATREFVASALGSKVKEITLDFAMNAPGYSDNKCCCSCAQANHYYFIYGAHFSLHFNLNRFNGCPLRILKLKDCKINISGYQNFASLEILWLTRVYPSNGTVQQMVQGLTSACTSLKVFGLEFYLFPSTSFPLEHLNITCWQLECMTFRCCHCFGSIVVDAPKLKYFEFKGELHDRFAFHLVNSPGLVSATFISSRSGEHFPVFSGVIAAKIIGQFAHVKFLTDTFYNTKDVIMVRNQRSATPVVFSQLKELKIERNIEDFLSVEEVLCFIRASPSLECLCISVSNNIDQMECIKECDWMDDQPAVIIYSLLRNRTRKIEISGFNGPKHHFELVKFLLHHLTTLVEITIHGCMASYSVHSSIISKLLQISPNPNIKLTYI